MSTSTHSTSGGLFIALEGGDGAGKSTQANLLAQALQSSGYRVVRTREPGGTEVGEKLRSIVLDHGQGEIDARTEALIFAASRAAHAEQLIRPALAEGKIVITDRYIDSSVAYQGAGRELGEQRIRELNEWATSDLLPHSRCCSTSPPKRLGNAERRRSRTGLSPNLIISMNGSERPF